MLEFKMPEEPLLLTFDREKYGGTHNLIKWVCDTFSYYEPESIIPETYAAYISAYDEDDEIASVSGYCLRARKKYPNDGPSYKEVMRLLIFDFSHIEELYNTYGDTVSELRFFASEEYDNRGTFRVPPLVSNCDPISAKELLQHMLQEQNVKQYPYIMHMENTGLCVLHVRFHDYE